jgi:hypothetical protein
MDFDYDSLMTLAENFDKKAEQLLETAESIRETAEIMTAGQKKTPEEQPKRVSTVEPKPPIAPPNPVPVVTSTPQSPPPTEPITSPSILKAEPPPAQSFNPPQVRIPKRVNGKTKLAPMEKLVQQHYGNSRQAQKRRIYRQRRPWSVRPDQCIEPELERAASCNLTMIT